MDTEKQRQCRRNNARLTERETPEASNYSWCRQSRCREWLPRELLSESECRGPFILDMKYSISTSQITSSKRSYPVSIILLQCDLFPCADSVSVLSLPDVYLQYWLFLSYSSFNNTLFCPMSVAAVLWEPKRDKRIVFIPYIHSGIILFVYRGLP